MKRFYTVLLAFALSAATAFAQPSIDAGGVTNAASYIGPALPNFGIAQGSMFVVKGKNLGACGVIQDTTLPLETTLSGTGIKVTVGGATKDALMIYVVGCRGGSLPDQLAAILPSDTPIGDGQITVTYNGQTSAAASIKVVRSAFGMFTINQGGSGPAIVQNYISQTEAPVLNLRTSAAKPGQAMILWGTGLGAISISDAGKPPVGNIAGVTVQVSVGGKTASVIYSGRSADFPGIDQVNFIVPEGISGCAVPIVVTVNNVPSNFGSLAVAATGPVCADAGGYTAADLELIRSKNGVKLGLITLARTKIKLDIPGLPQIPGLPDLSNITNDIGSASFVQYDLQAFNSSTAQATGYSIGSCAVSANVTSQGSVVDPILPVGLDAGSVSVEGPKGTKALTTTAGAKGFYSALLSGDNPLSGGTPFLDPGNYSVRATGGADVQAFTANKTLPAILTWSNQASISNINRANPLTITWTGGDPAGYVAITGSSTAADNKTTVAFSCTERVSAGQFTVPAAVLQSLPVSGTSLEAQSLMLVGATGDPTRFTATGIDIGFFTTISLEGKSVKFQ